MKVNDIRKDISKELEVLSFKVLDNNKLVREPRFSAVKSWIDGKKPSDTDKKKVLDQFSTFQMSMRVLLAVGLSLGLNPVSGLLQTDVSKIRFSIRSWVFVYALVQAIFLTITSFLNFYRLCVFPLGIRGLGFLIFYTMVTCTTIFFIGVARKWPNLMKELSNSGLDEYVDRTVIRKCNALCITMISLAILEHVLSIVTKVTKVLDCTENGTSYLEEYSKMLAPWYYDFNIMKHNIPVFIILQVQNVSSTAVWNYMDMFVVCISLYLSSILKQINKKIVFNAQKNHVQPAVWNALREDYTRAIRLIKLFDDTISSIVLVAFATDLFFICSQLFYVLSNSVRSVNVVPAKACLNYPSSPLQGYEYPIYITYSVIYLVARFLALSLMSAEVNAVSLQAAPAMYGISSDAYTNEVERFLNQINNTSVALSGLQFFYVTKELVLSVAGTIVTYELVLLQFTNTDLSLN